MLILKSITTFQTWIYKNWQKMKSNWNALSLPDFLTTCPWHIFLDVIIFPLMCEIFYYPSIIIWQMYFLIPTQESHTCYFLSYRLLKDLRAWSNYENAFQCDSDYNNGQRCASWIKQFEEEIVVRYLQCYIFILYLQNVLCLDVFVSFLLFLLFI